MAVAPHALKSEILKSEIEMCRITIYPVQFLGLILPRAMPQIGPSSGSEGA